MMVATKRDQNGTHLGRALRPRSYVGRTAEGGAVLEVELPGFGPEEVDIQVEGRLLTVRAEARETGEGSTLIGERARGEREAQFVLAENLDTDALEARMRDGILTIRIDRKPELKPRQIKIRKG